MNIRVSNEKNHYLFGNEGNHYFKGICNALKSLEPSLSRKQKNKLLKDLQIDGINFDEAKFLQVACETTIASYLSDHFQETFVYEPKINPPKDVDCGFSTNNRKINIEVKCPDFSKKNEIDNSNAFKIGSLGRLDNFDEVVRDMQAIFAKAAKLSPEHDKPLIKQQHMDNKLKDYLISAHNKFSDSAESNELNVLAVCCSGPTDMQKWFSYMYGPNGLFTPDSFYPYAEYSNVDNVILTNLYHRHYQYWEKDKLSDHWVFSNAFNLIFSNPLRKLDKEEAVWEMVSAIPNHSVELMNFKTIAGIEEMRISHFVVKELLNKGLYYFQPST